MLACAQVLLVSGREALLARLQLQGNASLESTTAFMKRAYGRSARVCPPCLVRSSDEKPDH